MGLGALRGAAEAAGSPGAMHSPALQPCVSPSSGRARPQREAPKRDKDKAAAVGKGQARLPYRRCSSAEQQESKTAKCLKLELPNPSWGSLERSPGPGALGERHKRQRRGRDGKGAWGPRQVERGTAGAGAAASPLPPSHPTPVRHTAPCVQGRGCPQCAQLSGGMPGVPVPQHCPAP